MAHRGHIPVELLFEGVDAHSAGQRRALLMRVHWGLHLPAVDVDEDHRGQFVAVCFKQLPRVFVDALARVYHGTVELYVGDDVEYARQLVLRTSGLDRCLED